MKSESCTADILIEQKLFRIRPNLTPAAPHERALLFVHGFLGDAEETWAAKGAPESFPSLLATDPETSDYDIFVFQYVTKDFHPPAIGNIAAQLRFAVKGHVPHDRIVLLAHSMGGLVCMRYILQLLEDGQPEARSIGGLLLYGSPMTGIEWAKYAQLVLRLGQLKIPILGLLASPFTANKQVKALTAGSEFIDLLNGAWILRILNGGHPEVKADQRAWFPVRVVTGNDDWVVKESSARGLYASRDWINTDEDHRALVKPRSRSSMTYQVASGFLKECRGWMSPQSLLKLRRQLDDILDVHRRKGIARWTFELAFDANESQTQANGFGLSGFRPFTVIQCSYRFRILHEYVKFGFAIGPIAAGAIWNDDFGFLHSVRFGALPVNQSDPIRKRLQTVVAEGAAGWDRIFDKVLLQVSRPDDDHWCPLNQQDVEQVSDGFVRRFVLPQEASSFVGREVDIKISFRGLLPSAITDYTVTFPWLCDTFVVRIAVDGNPSYIVDSQAMRGAPALDSKKEPGKIEYSSKDLILPGSYIRFEWGFEGTGHK